MQKKISEVMEDKEGRKKRAEEYKKQSPSTPQQQVKELQKQLEELKKRQQEEAQQKLQETAKQKSEEEKRQQTQKQLEELKRIESEKNEKEEIGQAYITSVKKGKKLGEGNFGAVYCAEWLGDTVALKSFKKNDLEEIEKEIHTFQ
jgi:hypothetical protein